MNETLKITLPSEMVDAIQRRVKNGGYASTSEVLREAMELLLQRESDHESRLASIRLGIGRSLEDGSPDISLEDMDEWLDNLAVEHRH
ncbi:ribbon-helix-helix domain-containing protein [Pararhizobium gei]|uniref:ribbon-helix-helix domain-containing protein n=1 Tax=Pararhizobium gei TaxID=1395951 RepID=UPI0023DC64C5|nr:ribbon-helix-helix domain-containing protein [Rhizobium gei]